MGLRSAATQFSLCILLILTIIVAGCDATKHLSNDEYLLRSNNVKLQTNKGITRRGELKDNINRLIAQKPNTYLLLNQFPYKVWAYNLRYDKYKNDSEAVEKNKLIEAPVVFDSTQVRRSVTNIKSYLFNQGYFYPNVTDTVTYKDKKASVTYDINTGTNFLIGKVTIDADDSTIATIVRRNMEESNLKDGQPFAMSLLEQERSRLANVLREHGYYRFTQENIVDFSLDTFNKDLVRNVYNPFETAINFLTAQKKSENPTLDVKIVIRSDNKDVVYKRYAINKILVFPDFNDRSDIRDSTLLQSEINDVTFRYHRRFVKEKVLLKHIFFEHDKPFSQTDYDATINKLNQLGVFQTIRIFLVNDSTRTDDTSRRYLNAYIIMSPSKKFDITWSVELSTGTTYVLGGMPTVSFRDFNLAKGANLLTVSASVGLESTYNTDVGDNFFQHFSLLTKTYALNASVDFPKFLAPFGGKFTKRNIPRTVIGFGTSLLDRVNYFTLTNTVANFTYNWRETSTNNWELSPAFMNIIRLPNVSDSFQRRLEGNDFLKNSYRETFIEGENISFTYSNQLDKHGGSYSYARIALEEAGGLVGLLSNTGINKFNFSQYLRIDFDARRYINRRHAQIAFRFYGGVGIPYNQSNTLPYIKQYFVGGAYSIRGWRIRTLGPGSYYNPDDQNTNSFIDRTGDLKLELNGEYRFDVIQLFSGGIKMRGALFADAGNIWLMKESSAYPGGAFHLSNLWNDVALSTGAGVRFDLAGFFIIRFDGAFPIKRPYNSIYDYGGWTGPFNGSWGISDVVLNIAVGYPF